MAAASQSIAWGWLRDRVAVLLAAADHWAALNQVADGGPVRDVQPPDTFETGRALTELRRLGLTNPALLIVSGIADLPGFGTEQFTDQVALLCAAGVDPEEIVGLLRPGGDAAPDRDALLTLAALRGIAVADVPPKVSR